ncbi:MAG: general secretion pathway protein GspB [Vicinamibacterales bacterium]|nr:general secretion pathway protein GspB [Vicinamibacterales bacterium]
MAEPAPWPRQDDRKPPAGPAGAAPPAPAPVLATAQPPSAPSDGEAPVVARERLPAHVQAELPALAIGGSIYSPRAAERTLIVNGRLYRENEALTADLVLERIGQKGAVLRYKGYRFEVPF